MKTAEETEIPAIFEFGPYQFDTGDKLLFRQGKEVHLTPKAAEVLLALLRRHGHVLEKDALMEEVWADTIVEENNLTRTISTLRKVFQEDCQEGYIETIPRRGYRLIAEVRAADARAAEVREPAAVRPEAAPTRRRAGAWTALWVAAGLLLLGVPLELLLTKIIGRGREPETREARLQVTAHPAQGQPSEAVVSPDGRWLAYAASDEIGRESLYYGPVLSSEAVELLPASEGGYASLSFAADGRNLFYTRREGRETQALYRLAVQGGGAPERLATLPGAGPVGLSPDGRRIAFVREEARGGLSVLIVAGIEGGDERRLVERRFPEFLSRASRPSWSADGRTIAFVIGTDGDGRRNRVATIPASGQGGPVVLAREWPRIQQATWMPDGRRLLVLAVEQAEGGRRQLWSLAWPKGEARRRIADTNDYSGFSCSADAARVVMVQGHSLSDVWIVPRTPSERSRRIVSFNERGDGLHGIDWTPDGRILFTSMEGDRERLWSMNANGGQRHELTGAESDAGSNYAPSVSPAGRFVAFVADRQGRTRIWRMEPDGSAARPLTDGPGDFDPRVSTDEQWIYYASRSARGRTLWKVPSEGGAPVPVTNGPAEAPAPNGTLVAWLETGSDADGPRRLAVSAGAASPRYFAFSGSLPLLRWMPEEQAVTYAALQNGIANLWRQPLSQAPPRRITDLSLENIASFAWARDGKRIALSRSHEMRALVLIEGLGQ